MMTALLQMPMQQMNQLGSMMWIVWVVYLVFYVFMAVCLQKIANKTQTDGAWWAWVPILNLLLMLKIAKKPLWWIILMLIPLVNLVIFIIVLIEICKARGKSPWLVVGLLLPLVNLFVFGYLAFAD